MKKEYVMPILALSLICLFVAGALAVAHAITQPIIKIAAAERAAVAMRDIMPYAEAFEPLELEGLPGPVDSIFRTTNNVGYIFVVTTQGFSGGITILCGIDPEGRVIRTTVLSHSETPTFSAPVFAESHAGQFWGRDRYGIEGVDVVARSTLTSIAYRDAIRYAFAAFDIATGGAR